MAVYPIGKMEYQPSVICKIVQESTGKNPAKHWNDKNRVPNNGLEYLLLLASLNVLPKDYPSLTTNLGMIETFMNYTFAVQDDYETICEIAMQTRLRMIHKEVQRNVVLCYITGNLQEWHEAFRNKSDDSLTRRILNDCQQWIEKDGFVFKETKIPIEDGTFYLEQK